MPDPQVGKSVWGPRTFLTVREFLWYNCSAVCGLSAQRLNGGINGDLLQEGSCHRLGDPDLLQPEPLPLWQATADPYLYRRHSNTGLTQSLGSLGHGSHKVLFEPSKCLWRVWDLALNMILPLLPSCWGFSVALKHGVSFFCGIQHSPVNGCSSTILYMLLFIDNSAYADNIHGNSLVVQWLGLCASTAGDQGFHPWSEN